MNALTCALAVATLGVMAGCSASPPRSSAPTPPGVFRFSQRVAATSPPVTLEGELTIERDTLLVSTTYGLCRYDPDSNGVFISYDCNGVVLTFDRADPVNRARYSLPTNVQVQIKKCVRYDTNASGQRVCVETRTEYEERREQRFGRLHLIRY